MKEEPLIYVEDKLYPDLHLPQNISFHNLKIFKDQKKLPEGEKRSFKFLINILKLIY